MTLLISMTSSSSFANPRLTLAGPEVGLEISKNNTATAHVSEVIRTAFDRNGYELKIVRLPYARSLKMTGEGLFDGELVRSREIETQYPNLLRVPEAIFTIEIIAISHAPFDLSDGWNALSGKSVGWLRGMKIIEKNLPPSSFPVGVRKVQQLAYMLRDQRVDCILFIRGLGIKFPNIQGQKLSLSEDTLAKVSHYIYLHEKHSHLVPKLAATLKAMKLNGSFPKIIAVDNRDH
ncbi:MAG: hypothetical protein KUG79_08315 [Pseudomonadales bacterium]|nr:hypothetical protein [Pseudomonadales bacterium]